MKTILLEGTELSGKTTLVRKLEDLAQSEGLSIKTNKGHINKSSRALNIIFKASNKVPPGNIREIGYTVGLTIDKDPRKVYGEIFDLFFQERGFPSVIAYSKVFHKFGFSKYFGELFLPFYPKFDYNFLVTCSNSERERRLRQRTNRTLLDEKIMEKIELAEYLESEMRNLLISQNNYEEITTESMDSEETARYVLARVK